MEKYGNKQCEAILLCIELYLNCVFVLRTGFVRYYVFETPIRLRKIKRNKTQLKELQFAHTCILVFADKKIVPIVPDINGT